MEKITKNREEEIKTVLGNVTKMLERRLFITKKGEKVSLLKSTKYTEMEDNSYKFDTHKGDFMVIIIYEDVDSFSKNVDMETFLSNYVEENKIAVANKFSSKLINEVDFNVKNIINLELFSIDDFRDDKIKFQFQPKFELLSPEEMEAVKEEYRVTNKTMPRFEYDDPIVRYFNLKKDDIIRIIRPSTKSGSSIYYRMVYVSLSNK
jgi:DNA-directed RNA polymerase subunit H (RpoH/RPB5)